MGHKAVAVTARLTAAARAVESRRADRLFEDPLADALADEDGLRLMERWRLPGMPRENPTIGPGTRFYDDLVMQAVAGGVGQVVRVAAAMDTRAVRLPLPAEMIVFTLDQPELLEEKQAILDRHHALQTPLPGEVLAVPSEQGMPRVLTRRGLVRPDSPTAGIGSTGGPR